MKEKETNNHLLKEEIYKSLILLEECYGAFNLRARNLENPEDKI